MNKFNNNGLNNEPDWNQYDFSHTDESDTTSFASMSSNNMQTNKAKANDNDNNHEGLGGFEFLIPFINMLQTVFRASGISNNIIELPQIVVVGAQSVGKTSVLESLVQKSFLPRGDGIMTRCPIILKLINTSAEKHKGEWCEFTHIKDKKFNNFIEVQQIISDYTKRIASNGEGISKRGIQLTIYSPNVVTLTVVDLPGLVKVASAGQSDDIITKVRELVLDYITPKNSLILAVSTANNDLENSESLAIAKEVDPNRDRTLAVLTKLDLAPDPSKLLKILKCLVVPVKLGIIGVINRSDEDVTRNKNFKDTMERENRFLMERFPSIASQHGTKFLALRLNRLLLNHIQLCFPQLDKKLKDLSSTFKERLAIVGNPEEISNVEKRHRMVNIITEFSTAYKAQVEGRSRKVDLTVPCGGARIDHIFLVNLIDGLRKLSPFDNVSNSDIIIAVRNSRQIGSRLFIPEDAFQEIVKIQIGKMRNPVMDCANRIYEEMIKMVPQCLSEAAERFPKVNRQITQIVGEMLYTNFETSKQFLEQYIHVQSSSAITAQEDFYELMAKSVTSLNVMNMGKLPMDFIVNGPDDDLLKSCGQTVQYQNSNSVSEAGNQTDVDDNADSDDTESQNQAKISSTIPVTACDSLSKQQLSACSVVRELMNRFFTIVLHQVQDFVPKSLLFTLVYATVDNVHQELIKYLVIEDKINDLMKESESVIAHRQAVRNDLEVIEAACKQLEELQEKCIY